MTATADRYERAPELFREHDPLIEQRVGRDLVLAAHRDRHDTSRWYVLAYDADGNYLSRIASGTMIQHVAATWASAVATARDLYPHHIGPDPVAVIENEIARIEAEVKARDELS